MPICMRINWTWDWIKNQDCFPVPLDSLNLTQFGVDCLVFGGSRYIKTSLPLIARYTTPYSLPPTTEYSVYQVT